MSRSYERRSWEAVARARPLRARVRATGGAGGAGRVLVLALAVLSSACRTDREPVGSDPGVVTADEFVEIVTALREAERSVTREDSAEALFNRRKAEILERHGASEADLHAFLDRNAGDVELLQEVWDSVTERLKHVPDPTGDTTGVPRAPGRIPGPGRPGPASENESLDRRRGPPPGGPGTGEQRLH